MPLADGKDDPASDSGRARFPEKLRAYSEQASCGVDSHSPGITSSIYGGPAAITGLRVPTLVSPNRYVFLCATRRVAYPGFIVHKVRQHVTLCFGLTTPAAGTTVWVEQPQAAPMFQFVDGNVSWHLVVEPCQTALQRSSKEAASFSFYESDEPALLFEDATWTAGNFNPLTGAPIVYDVGMATYVPPGNIPTRWNPVPGYGCRNDVFAPWTSDTTVAVQVPVERDSNVKVSLYATVLQTNPSTRPTIAVSASLGPDWQFVAQYPFADGTNTGVQYGRVAGAMLVEQLEWGDVRSGTGPCWTGTGRTLGDLGKGCK